MGEKWKLLWEIGRLRAKCLTLRVKEALVLLEKCPFKDILGDILKIREERIRVEAKIVELRKQYDEIGKGGAR
jgi:hypothetical protein